MIPASGGGIVRRIALEGQSRQKLETISEK
jgi:hypothetical protein